MRRCAWVLGVLLLWSGHGLGQSSDAARAAARQLANSGVADYQAGSYPNANQKLERAFATVKAPSIGLWSARALVKVGRLVEASERYLEVTRLDAKQGDEAVQKQAQADATREYDELQARIPTLTVQPAADAGAGAIQVTVDGAPVAASLVGVPVPTNPGEHAVEAKQGALVAKAHVTLVEGRPETVRLELGAPVSKASAPSLPTPANDAPATSGTPAPTADAMPAETRRTPTVTWVALGVSAVGLAVGSVTGLMAKSQREELEPRCPNDLCDSKDRSSVDQMNSLRTVSTIGFIVGGVGLASAGVTWFTLRAEPKQHGFSPSLRSASITVHGAF